MMISRCPLCKPSFIVRRAFVFHVGISRCPRYAIFSQLCSLAPSSLTKFWALIICLSCGNRRLSLGDHCPSRNYNNCVFNKYAFVRMCTRFFFQPSLVFFENLTCFDTQIFALFFVWCYVLLAWTVPRYDWKKKNHGWRKSQAWKMKLNGCKIEWLWKGEKWGKRVANGGWMRMENRSRRLKEKLPLKAYNVSHCIRNMSYETK